MVSRSFCRPDTTSIVYGMQNRAVQGEILALSCMYDLLSVVYYSFILYCLSLTRSSLCPSFQNCMVMATGMLDFDYMCKRSFLGLDILIG